MGIAPGEPPRLPSRQYTVLLALACGVLYLALIVASFGLLELFANTEVVSMPELGPLVGPLMVAAAVVTLTGMLLLRPARANDDGLDWGYALLVGIAATAAYVLMAFIAGVADLGAAEGLHFAFVTVLGGYDLLIAVLGVAVALAYSFTIARRYDQRGRPRWSWEDDFDV